ncbi:hypothetical protein AX16_003888 [Volvariella volvacea WC 439]|nr:hypothetical protein AX16_003888 [Volvariella volvacea WC 439]
MQFVVFTLLSLAASFFCATSTLATPIKEYRSPHTSAMCHPNFEGVCLSVTDNAQEWGTSPASVPYAPIINFSHRGSMLAHADFRFEQDGQYLSHYIVKDIGNNELVASVRDNKLLLLNQNRNDQTQLWNVVCDECKTNISNTRGQVAVGCKIASVPSGLCATNTRVTGEALILAPCDGRVGQSFDFWTES